MIAKVAFANVRFKQASTQEIDVALNQPFDIDIELEAGDDEELRIATIGDAITEVRESNTGLSAKVTATALGKGEIQLQNAMRGVEFWLSINVFNPADAVSLTAREIGDEPRD